jgi:hypothetical protein
MDTRSMTLEDKVQYLLDRQDIRDVIARYSRGQDDHQDTDGNVREDWDHVFTEDAVLDYATGGYPSDKASYREIAEWMRGPNGDDGRMSVFSAWQHHLGPSTVTISGDTASAKTDMWCTHKGKPVGDDGASWYLCDAVTFVDELVRTQGGWRINYRRNVIHWIDSLAPGQDPSEFVGTYQAD